MPARAPVHVLSLLMVLLSGAGLPAAGSDDEGRLRVLGAPPLCEASALLRVPDGSGRWIVADNEIHDRLFVFRNQDGWLVPDPRAPVLDLRAVAAPHDIEALAWNDGTLVVIGSHSRGRDCKAGSKRFRRRIVQLRIENGAVREVGRRSGDDAIEALQRKGASTDDCVAALFVGPAPDGARAVCKALRKAERKASPRRCETFDVEGAFALDGRVWLGLRSPRVGGDAVLLRLVPEPELRFDALRRIPLEGQGIRALTTHDDRVLGVAGDGADRSASRLWVSGNTTGSRVRILAELPPTAEGIALGPAGDFGILVTDGEASSRSAACRVPSQQQRLPLGLR